MRHIITSLAAFLVAGLALAAPAQAQNLCTFNGADGVKVTCSAANPLPVTGSGGGGGGDASAANQTTQITAAQLTNTTLGAVTASPATNTIGDRLKTLNTTLGTPLQAGGSVTITGTPTINAQTPGNSLCHIGTATTTTCKSGAGVLHTLSVNNLGTVASLTTVYDNTAGSGTVIASINTLAGQTSYLYDIAFGTGLTIVTTGTVAPDVTISYR